MVIILSHFRMHKELHLRVRAVVYALTLGLAGIEKDNSCSRSNRRMANGDTSESGIHNEKNNLHKILWFPGAAITTIFKALRKTPGSECADTINPCLRKPWAKLGRVYYHAN